MDLFNSPGEPLSYCMTNASCTWVRETASRDTGSPLYGKSPVGVGVGFNVRFEVGSEVAGSTFGPAVGSSDRRIVHQYSGHIRRGGGCRGDFGGGRRCRFESRDQGRVGSKVKVDSEVAGFGSEEVQSYSSLSSSVLRLRHRHRLLHSYVDFCSRRRGSQY